MTSRRRVLGVIAAMVAAVCGAAVPSVLGAQAGAVGTIRGHVKLNGPEPGNTVIRMRMDPKCAKINAGKQVVQEAVLVALDGSLANVFVHLQGPFPQSPVPRTPVVIDQQGCIYHPRVLGARVGQVLQVKNSDDLFHNVHGTSAVGNGFNISEPRAGMIQPFTLRRAEVMLKVRCDVHSWMTSFVGVVEHPYFAVSNRAGTFEIANVPVGTHTILTWHERYGVLKQTVRVQRGAVTTVELGYTGKEKRPN